MAVVHHVHGMRAFGQLFAKHQRERWKRILAAVRRTARQAIAFLKQRVPAAFGELALRFGAQAFA